jgi:Domain of unknown function (DUF4395)
LEDEFGRAAAGEFRVVLMLGEAGVGKSRLGREVLVCHREAIGLLRRARGYLPRTIRLIWLALMWMESVFGLCLGCRIYGVLVRRGWMTEDPEIELCADGAREPNRLRTETSPS